MQRFTICETHDMKPVEIPLERFKIGVVLILLDRSDDGGGPDKACDVIYMAIGIISFDTIAEPQDFSDAQFLPQFLLNGGAIKSWVSVRIQQATLGREESISAVCFY